MLKNDNERNILILSHASFPNSEITFSVTIMCRETQEAHWNQFLVLRGTCDILQNFMNIFLFAVFASYIAALRKEGRQNGSTCGAFCLSITKSPLGSHFSATIFQDSSRFSSPFFLNVISTKLSSVFFKFCRLKFNSMSHHTTINVVSNLHQIIKSGHNCFWSNSLIFLFVISLLF